MNLQLANQPTPNRMSSREVAQLTGKQHGNVMRDIREMVQTLTDSNLNWCVESAYYTGGDGREYPMYQMDKETTICLLTGYDAAARMKVIQRWQQLEEAQAPTAPQTFTQALRAALAQAQPAVEFMEQVASSKDAMPVGEAAKLLGVGPNTLFAFLRDQKIFMNGQGGQHRNMPYQQHLDAGRFRVVEQPFNTPDGKTHINVKPLVTQRGLEYIRKALSAFS
jgi:Rha family phage regulatory protein